MRIALLTTYLAGYRTPLYERLAASHGLEVLCYGGGARYAPPWISEELDVQIADANFPAARLDGGPRAAFAAASRYDVVIAPYAGGAILPAAYAGARRSRRAFILWASVWAQPRSATNLLALPVTRHIYRHADAVVAYGEHVRRFVAGIRGHDDDVFVAPQSVEPELFGVVIPDAEIAAFHARHSLDPERPIVLYAGRLVHEKGVDLLLSAWRSVRAEATLVLIGDGPLADLARSTPGARLLGVMPRAELPVAYAACAFTVLPSVPTPRFREPWGLVCNEAMHRAKPVLATTAVGAVAGGLVRDGITGVVVGPGDQNALARAIDRLLADEPLRARLGASGHEAVAAYNYEAMSAGFERALAIAIRPSPTGP
jgi:glycosyltransferase involved in cell wall biosynthesis